MKAVFNIRDGYLYTLTLCLLPLLMLAIFSNDYRVYDYYFNPDSLYLDSLYRALFIDGYPLISYNLNPSVLLVPDVMLFFPLRALTGNVIIASFIFSIIQHLLIFGFVLLIFRRVLGSFYLKAGAFSNLLFLVFFLGAILSKDILFAAFSLVSTNHVGVFVMMLISVWLLLEYLVSQRKSILIILFLVSLLSTFSDRLFILMLPVPLLLMLIIGMVSRRKTNLLLPFIIVLISAAGGFLLQEFANGRYFYLAKIPVVFDPSGIIPAFNLMMADLWAYLAALDTHTFIIVLSVVSLLLQIYLAVIMIRKKQIDSPAGFYLVFSVIYIFIIFWMPVLTGSYIAKHILRYNISAFYLAMINLPVVVFLMMDFRVSRIATLRILKSILVVGIAVMFLIGVSNLSGKGIRNFFDYYPDFVRELDEIALQEDLLNGVSHFWIAKPITTFSKTGTEVYHTWPNFEPYFHVNCRNHFTGQEEVYNFAVISSFDDQKAYLEHLNHPGRIVKNGNTKVLILPPFKFDVESGIPYFIDKSATKK